MLTGYDFCFKKEIEKLSLQELGLIPIFFLLLKENNFVKVFLIYSDKLFFSPSKLYYFGSILF